MPPIYLTSDLLSYKRKPNLFNPVSKTFGDPYLDNVVLYLRGDGANGSTNIVDESPTPKAISVFGDSQISTAQSKYGGSSIYFDGNGDYLTTEDSSDYAFGTGNFTIELWLFKISTTQVNLIDFRPSGNNGVYPLIYFSSGGNMVYLVNSGTRIIVSEPPLNTWNHVALVRSNAVTQFYINGIVVGDAYSDSFNYTSSQFPTIGSSSTKSEWFLDGFISSLRITRAARYTANFDPETDTYLAY